MAYVYEFLYRGRPNGESAYHVVLADVVNTLGRDQHVESNALTPEQAEARGFPLKAVLAEINTVVMAERDQALADKAAAERERDIAVADKEAAERERDQALAVDRARAPVR